MIKWSGECFFFVLIDLVICLCSIHIPLAHILPIFNSELFSRGQLSKTFTSDAVVSECENQYLHFLVIKITLVTFNYPLTVSPLNEPFLLRSSAPACLALPALESHPSPTTAR